MNLKELVTRTMIEAGIPTATFVAGGVAAASGEALRVVGWVQGAYNDIQTRRKWHFMWENVSITVPAGSFVVPAATVGAVQADRYEKDSLFDAYGANFGYISWADFRSAFPAVLIFSGTPSLWTIRPDGAFVVNAKPTADSTYTVDRYMRPQVMEADADEPILPTEFHLAIVWRALLLYCNFEEAGISRATAQVEYDRLMNAMGGQLLPDMIPAAPLA